MTAEENRGTSRGAEGQEKKSGRRRRRGGRKQEQRQPEGRTASGQPPKSGRRGYEAPKPRTRPADAPPAPRGYLSSLIDEEDEFDFLDVDEEQEPAVEGEAPAKAGRRRRRKKKATGGAAEAPAAAAGATKPPAKPAAKPQPSPRPSPQPPEKERPPKAAEKQRPPKPAEKQLPPKPEEKRPPKPAEKRPPKPAERRPPGPEAERPRRRRRGRGAPPAAAEQAEQAEQAERAAPPPREAKPPKPRRPDEHAERRTKPAPAQSHVTAPPEKRAPRAGRQPSGFTPMGLSDTMLDALDAAGYLEPTPVQTGLIPKALEGIDVMGQARTGTGKTAAFAIPLLERIERRLNAPAQALVLVPTRELAVQVRDECNKLAAGRDLNVVAVYGGKPIRDQAEHLRRGAEFLVGTPGRVIDMMNRGMLQLGELRFVVLDEADRMLDIGFRPDIEKILRRCPAERQTLLLSATIPPPVKRLAERYMRQPEMLDFSPGDVAVETIEQFYFSVDPERKVDLLVKLLEREKPAQAIVFCRTRRGADRLYRKLSPQFEHVDAIHGDLAQSARDRVMRRFRDGKTRVLVATDVVGRGIDVTGISHIINFDIPQFSDDYVHRVGRTGRMGREGIAFTFVSPEEGNELTRIEMRINRLLKRDEIPGFLALEKPKPTDELEEGMEPFEPPAPKPVFGARGRRYRRAL